MSERNFLEEIISRRRRALPYEHPRGEIAARGPARNSLRAALRGNRGRNIIGEFKRASPSLGYIRRDANPTQIARQYENAGVCALSILTEPDFFHGSIEDLVAARAVTKLPILRKDFIVESSQIEESANAGADAILLIVAALSDSELAQFRARAEEDFGLDALVEVHNEEEMRRAADAGATLIGVNNRDLRTFLTSLETSERLAPLAPAGALLVSESGISLPNDVARLTKSGFAGFLVGEMLMRAEDPTAVVRDLLRHV